VIVFYANDCFTSGVLQTTNLGYLNPLLVKTYSVALAHGYTRHPCSKKPGHLYASIPFTGGGVSSYAYSLREYGRFFLLLKVCVSGRSVSITLYAHLRDLGKRHNITYLWAYMLLGQIVAISVASNLFYLALVLSERSLSSRNKLSLKKTVSARLVVSVLLSLVTVALSPFTSPKTFLPNLLVMHVLLFVPLISIATTSSSSETSFSVNLNTLYRVIHLACAGIHIRTVIAAVGSLQTSSKSADIFKDAWKILYSHPAQSSIGWDVIWTSLSFIAWILLRPPRGYNDGLGMLNKYYYGIAMYLMLATPVASIAVTAPYALQSRGDVAEGERRDFGTDSEKKKKIS
jgi:hypothetical protein